MQSRDTIALFTNSKSLLTGCLTLRQSTPLAMQLLIQFKNVTAKRGPRYISLLFATQKKIDNLNTRYYAGHRDSQLEGCIGVMVGLLLVRLLIHIA